MFCSGRLLGEKGPALLEGGRGRGRLLGEKGPALLEGGPLALSTSSLHYCCVTIHTNSTLRATLPSKIPCLCKLTGPIKPDSKEEEGDY